MAERGRALPPAKIVGPPMDARPMPFRKRETAEHARQQQHFKDIEQSLKDAANLLASSKLEIERSKRIMKDMDQPTAARPSQSRTNDR